MGVSPGLVPESSRTLFSLHIGRVVGLVNICFEELLDVD